MHSDDSGPITLTSKIRSRYIIPFVDNYSKYTIVKLVKSKSQILEKIVEYNNSVEDLHGLEITCLKCDNSEKYI